MLVNLLEEIFFSTILIVLLYFNLRFFMYDFRVSSS